LFTNGFDARKEMGAVCCCSALYRDDVGWCGRNNILVAKEVVDEPRGGDANAAVLGMTDAIIMALQLLLRAAAVAAVVVAASIHLDDNERRTSWRTIMNLRALLLAAI